jgi:isoquinoline 1-oxidoreductase beta subunit
MIGTQMIEDWTHRGVVKNVHRYELFQGHQGGTDHMWAAIQGLAALDIEWDEGPNAKVSSADIVRQMETASQKPGVVGRKDGDVSKAMAGAAKKVEAVYQVPFLAHATMEPMNCTVHVRQDGCDVWVGSQVVSRAQATAAEVTGLPLEQVQVFNQFLGGGFGRRSILSPRRYGSPDKPMVQ